MKKLLLSLVAVALGFSANAEVIYSEPFTESLGGFTTYGELPEGLDYVWAFDAQYGAKASAYVNGTRYETESWLVSPEIDLSGVSNVSLSFSQAVNYISGKVVSDFCQIYVGEAGTDPSVSAWSNISKDVNYPAGNNWTFVESGNISLSDFEGKKIQLAFLYKSTSEVAPTWEVKSVVVESDASSTPVIVPELSVAEALVYLDSNEPATVIVTGYVTKVGNLGNSGGLTYYLGDSVDASETLQVYYGLGLDGATFSSPNDVLVGAKVQVKGYLKLYNGTPEIDSNSVMLSYNDDGLDTPTVPDAPQGVLSVAEAVNDYINKGYRGKAMVKGIISEIISEEVSNYGSLTYNIVDELGSSTYIQVYSGLGLNGEKFQSVNEIEIGATVVVSGDLTLYNNIPEFNYNNYIVEYTAASGAVKGISSDLNAPVEYFNLQGVKVTNPAQGGLYIIRQGDKTTKAIIR